MPTAEYTRFVHRVWDSLQQRTGRPVYYLDSSLIAGYCPACLDGTLRVRFLEHPRPGMTVGSERGRPRTLLGGMLRRADRRGAVRMSPISDHDADRIGGRGKPRPKGKIPYPPDRNATLPELRGWISDAGGLPAEVRIEAVFRAGRESGDPITLTLSNGMSLRCPHQRLLQQPGTLQAFLASESDGIAQPAYLSRPEAGDFYTVLCRLGTASAKADPIGDLHEQLAMFVAIWRGADRVDRRRRAPVRDDRGDPAATVV